uniref:Uncharacterized protein n=2 Tax=Caenorhabditis japonica TaxID=281687 RepID=A0A8R1I4A1_CAEJA
MPYPKSTFLQQMSVSVTWRTFVRQIENMDFESKLRAIRRYPKRRLALILAILMFFIFIFTRNTSSGQGGSKEQQCSAEKLKLWRKEIEEFDTGINNASVEFVGNGFFGLDSLGQLRFQDKNRVLDVETGFYPALSVEIDGPQPVEVTKITDFKNGALKVMRCYSVVGLFVKFLKVHLLQDGECACVTSQIYAHRTRPNYFVQIVQISNPTKSTVRLSLSRLGSNWWAHSKSGDLPLSQRHIAGAHYAIVVVDKKNFLASESAGGVELAARAGKIKVSSTLESRLDLIANQIVPQVRTALFGPNPNRAFFD